MTTNIGVDKGYRRVQHCGSEGQLIGKSTVRSLSTAGDLTYTPSQFLSSTIKRDPNGTLRTDTLPTAALIALKFPEVQVGDYFEVDIYNTGNGDGETLTLSAGTNNTIVGESIIPQGCRCHIRYRFTAVSTPAAEVYTSLSYPYSGGLSKLKIQSITTSPHTLTLGQSGTIFCIDKADGVAFTLPALTGSSGVWYEFWITTTITTAATVTCAAANTLFGHVAIADVSTGTDGATTGTTNATPADIITFVAASDSLGDHVRIFSNGTFWFARGVSNLAAGITLT